MRPANAKETANYHATTADEAQVKLTEVCDLARGFVTRSDARINKPIHSLIIAHTEHMSSIDAQQGTSLLTSTL